MRTKLLVGILAVVTFLLKQYTSNSILIPFVFFLIFIVYGIATSVVKGRDPFNDVPNSFRIFLGSFSGALVSQEPVHIVLSILLFVSGILLNDEYQRKVIDSVRKGRKGGTVAFLGIDGSGKSSHTRETAEWLKKRGYYVSIVPFHRYLFVERLSRKTKREAYIIPKKGNPLRPIFSLIDNLLLFVISSFGSGIEGKIVIYDRFIWSTYIKYDALNYPVLPLRFFYFLLRPTTAIVLDIPVERSLSVIQRRPEHIRYRRKTLSREREEYIKIAKRRGYPIVDSTEKFSSVQERVQSFLSYYFPEVK